MGLGSLNRGNERRETVLEKGEGRGGGAYNRRWNERMRRREA